MRCGGCETGEESLITERISEKISIVIGEAWKYGDNIEQTGTSSRHWFSLLQGDCEYGKSEKILIEILWYRR